MLTGISNINEQHNHNKGRKMDSKIVRPSEQAAARPSPQYSPSRSAMTDYVEETPEKLSSTPAAALLNIIRPLKRDGL